ncbi:MAG TPA: DoxX family protein [Acidimicrobiales bacterium]|nr:DoxX family protein [Acidimicrobiales bacterium]
MGFATTALRVVTGATMAGHGLQKLTNMFGGQGPDGTGQSFEQMGFKPGRPFAIATGLAETAGGTLMVAGLGVPAACAMVSGVMVGAIARVHYKHGFWAMEHGFEYNLHILAATFAVAGTGGGSLTLDALRGKHRRGLGWAVAQLAVGAGAAAGALALSERLATDQASPGGGADEAERTEADRIAAQELAPEPGTTPGAAVHGAAHGGNGPLDLTEEGTTGDQAASSA